MPDPIFAAAAGALGAIAGSFLNALLYRYRTGRSVLYGRSACMRCAVTLEARDLVPLVSFVFLRGRCRHCKSPISVQYPLVELSGIVLGILVYLKHQEPVLFAVSFLIWMTLLFVAVYDLRHGVIPWVASGVLAVLALLHAFLTGSLPPSLEAGAILAAPLLAISLLSQGKAMGWGDGALEFGLGTLLGLFAGFSALMLAVWSGAIVGIVLSAVSRRYTMSSEVPFAPFLIFGAACAYFFDVTIFSGIPTLPLFF